MMSHFAALLIVSSLLLLFPGCSGTAMDIEKTTQIHTFPVNVTDELMATVRSVVKMNNWSVLLQFVRNRKLEFMEHEIFDAAAFFGSLDILVMLWPARKDNVFLNEKQALVYAAAFGQWATFQWLTENCRCSLQDDCYYPLGIAISYGQAQLVLDIIKKYGIKSRVVDYSFIDDAMRRNHFDTIRVLMSCNWIMPLDTFDEVCAKGHLQLVKHLFVHQRQSITCKHVTRAIHVCTRSKAFDVIRFLLKRFSDQIEGSIIDALEYAIKRVSSKNSSDHSYMELVRIIVYDGRTRFTSEMLKVAQLRKNSHIFGLMQSADIMSTLKSWLDYYDPPRFNDPLYSFTFECLESGLRWSILKGDTALGLYLLGNSTRSSLKNLPSKSAWLSLMDHLVDLGQKFQRKLILRTIVEMISIRCIEGNCEGSYFPIQNARRLHRIHLSLSDLGMRYWKRDFMALSLLLHRYSIHVLTMVGYLTIGVALIGDISAKILEDVLCL